MGDYDRAGMEPPLSEVLAEPIVHLLMRRDHVADAELRQLVRRSRRSIRRAQLQLRNAA